jgi:hypothetical protein
MTIRTLILAGLAALTLWTSASVRVHAQQPAAPPHQHDQTTTEPAAPKSAADMPAMKGMQEMMAANAKLQALVSKMNAASGQAKVDAMAELLTAIVGEHTAMQQRMMSMMPMMQSMPMHKD